MIRQPNSGCFLTEHLCYCSGTGHHQQTIFQSILIMLYVPEHNMQLHKEEMGGYILQVAYKAAKTPEI